jgi:hypothetical protein
MTAAASFRRPASGSNRYRKPPVMDSRALLPFVWDEGGHAHDAFELANMPALAVIDGEGRVRLKRVGFNAAETDFANNLTSLLESL